MAKTPRIMASDKNPIGMLAHSLLTEAQFQALNGTGWILADGRSIVGSKYAIINGASTVPDLRGVVLRGKNNGRADGNQNPDGDLALGTYQADMFASHTHNVGNGTGGSNVTGQPFAGGTTNPQSGATGGNETRMKNVTVNIFIKINE